MRGKGGNCPDFNSRIPRFEQNDTFNVHVASLGKSSQSYTSPNL